MKRKKERKMNEKKRISYSKKPGLEESSLEKDKKRKRRKKEKKTRKDCTRQKYVKKKIYIYIDIFKPKI